MRVLFIMLPLSISFLSNAVACMLKNGNFNRSILNKLHQQ